MSSIYIQEPPTKGKILLQTTVGDIDVELWPREAPKACRNFVQLCMEKYYNGTIFHRLIKEFIVQGGDPTGTGAGGSSIYDKPFKDEFHSRLRFVRRGLVAMANGGKSHDNGSQFFFTLGPTPELQNKHTIFGKVGGDTIYNMIKLGEGPTGEDDRPMYPHKILSSQIIYNPFEDIVPRDIKKEVKKKDEEKEKKTATTGTKNFKLLSFGEEAEEEEEEIFQINKKFSKKGKSSHDLTHDPKLSSSSGLLESRDLKRTHPDSDLEEPVEDDDTSSKSITLQNVKERLQKKDAEKVGKKPRPGDKPSKAEMNQLEVEPYYLGKDDVDERQRKLEKVKQEFKDLKRLMKKEASEKRQAKLSADKESIIKEKEGTSSNEVLDNYLSEQKVYQEKAKILKNKSHREAKTLELLNKFKCKINSAKELGSNHKSANASANADEDDENPNDISWLAKPLISADDDLILAKDANKKSDDWFEIHDPRNPLVKRRREESKKLRNKEDKWKKIGPLD